MIPYEVTMSSFNGSTDETDDLVLWVQAPNEYVVMEAYPAASIVSMSFNPPDCDIDRSFYN